MLVDFDYFFAQCEELRNPAFKDKPVVVGVYSGRTEESGVVSTANYVARERGVKSGIPLYLARKRLQGIEAVFLPIDLAFYAQISDRIMQVLRSYADSFEQTSIDEAYLESRKCQDDFRVEQIAILWFTTSRNKAHNIRRAVLQCLYPDYFLVGLIEDAGHFVTKPIWWWNEAAEPVCWVRPPGAFDAAGGRR